jgi:hypothetical protein
LTRRIERLLQFGNLVSKAIDLDLFGRGLVGGARASAGDLNQPDGFTSSVNRRIERIPRNNSGRAWTTGQR